MSTLLYIFWNWMRGWENFSFVVLVLLLAVVGLGIGLLARQKGVKLQVKGAYFLASIITSIGLLGITAGLVWGSDLPNDLARAYAFIFSPLLLLTGIALALKPEQVTR